MARSTNAQLEARIAELKEQVKEQVKGDRDTIVSLQQELAAVREEADKAMVLAKTRRLRALELEGRVDRLQEQLTLAEVALTDIKTFYRAGRARRRAAEALAAIRKVPAPSRSSDARSGPQEGSYPGSQSG